MPAAHAQRLRSHRLPSGLARDLDAVVTAQKRALARGEPARTGPGDPMLEHVAAGEAVYLPLGAGPTARPLRAGVGLAWLATAALGGGALAAVAFGGAPWPTLLGLGAAVAFVVGVGLLVTDAALARRRARGVARFGLVLTPSHLVLWRAAWCRVAPREAVERFFAERGAGGYRECVDVRGPDGLERWIVHPRASTSLRYVLQRWRADERPWVAPPPDPRRRP